MPGLHERPIHLVRGNRSPHGPGSCRDRRCGSGSDLWCPCLASLPGLVAFPARIERPRRHQRVPGAARTRHAPSQHAAHHGRARTFATDGADGLLRARVGRRLRLLEAPARLLRVGALLVGGRESALVVAGHRWGRALKLWLASPEHRKNLVDPTWREIGVSAVHVAHAPGVYHGRDVTIVTTDFGVRH